MQEHKSLLMQEHITFHDKILALLYQYRYLNSDMKFGAPFEITQDGIGSILGISRSHASIIISKMEDDGEVISGSSTIRDSNRPNKRRVYHLTECGKRRYLERYKDLQSKGLDLDETIVLNEMSEDDFQKLTQYQSDMVGCFCLLEQKVTRDTFPQDIPYVHFRPTGAAYIKDDVKTRVLKHGTPENMRRWHSKAADWCIDHENGISERLFHLDHAFRDREAIKLIKSRKYQIMDDPSSRLGDVLFDLSSRNEDLELMEIAARILICTMDYDKATRIIMMIADEDDSLGGLLFSELLLRQHRFDDAWFLINSYNDGGPESEMISGICLLWYGNAKEAKDRFEKARVGLITEHCIFKMDLLMVYEAFANMMIGDNESAKMMIDMATALSRNEKRRADLTALAGRLFPFMDSEDCVLLESIDIGDV